MIWGYPCFRKPSNGENPWSKLWWIIIFTHERPILESTWWIWKPVVKTEDQCEILISQIFPIIWWIVFFLPAKSHVQTAMCWMALAKSLTKNRSLEELYKGGMDIEELGNIASHSNSRNWMLGNSWELYKTIRKWSNFPGKELACTHESSMNHNHISGLWYIYTYTYIYI